VVRAICLAALSALLIATPGAAAATSLREPLRDKPGGFLTRPSDERPVTVALEYVRAHPKTFGLDDGDIGGLRLASAYRSGAGTVHLQWEQVYRGIPVFGPGLRANVAADGRLINVGEGAVPDPGVTSVRPRLPKPAADASLTLFNGNRLAWRFLRRADATHVYDTVVDANTGERLYRANKVREATFRVFDNYPSAPAGGDPSDVTRNGWLTSSTALSGPNAHVYSDENGSIEDYPYPPGGPDPSTEIPPSAPDQWLYSQVTQGSASPGPSCPLAGCTWDSFDGTPAWDANREQAGTQLFYFVNTFHDWLRDAPGVGFSAASGNHEGSDPVQAQVDDGAALPEPGSCNEHRNNAYVLPIADGTPMLMQFLLWSGNCISGFNDVNPADDAYVVYHEYTHGMSNRLVTYSDGTPGLDAEQSWSMDEGLADWYALDYLVSHALWADPATAGDLAVGEYENTDLRSQPIDCPVGAAAAICPGWGTAGSGGYTYGDFAKVFPLGWEPHADGEIWVETLWDLRAAMLAAHPSDGLTRTRAVVTDAMRLVGSNPSFLDMRNGILTAASLRGYGDGALIWRVFAARGMGAGATTNGPRDLNPHEDFTVPQPPPAPPTPPPGDFTKPRLSSSSMLRRSFKVGVRSAFKFTLSEVATVQISLARAQSGRRVRGRCRPASRKLRKRPRCTRYVATGSIVKKNMSAGKHSVAFAGRLRGRALKPGSYRATIRATDPTGNRARAATLTFRIIRR
jgi:extracellular elastinolytic metalloproteinase